MTFAMMIYQWARCGKNNHNFHTELICKALRKVSDRKIQRLSVIVMEGPV